VDVAGELLAADLAAATRSNLVCDKVNGDATVVGLMDLDATGGAAGGRVIFCKSRPICTNDEANAAASAESRGAAVPATAIAEVAVLVLVASVDPGCACGSGDVKRGKGRTAAKSGATTRGGCDAAE
jgi:hypothetical protein